MEDRRFPVVAEYQRRYSDERHFGSNRLAALNRDSYACVACGMTNTEHVYLWGCNITVDHIDGNGSGSPSPNNDLNNLQTLCLRCHGAKDGGRYDPASRKMPQGEDHPASKLSGIVVVQMRQARRAGATYLDLAATYGVAVGVAYSACVGLTWRSVNDTEPPVMDDHNGFTRTGATHKSAKLNPDSVRAMRRDRRAGMSYKQLAVKYGVVVNAAHQVCTGKTWKSVPMEE